MRAVNQAAPWTADRELDAEGAAGAIHEAVPALAGCAVERLGSGWDFDTFQADGTWAFRFPRREGVQAWLLKDLLVLPWVVDRVDLPVPRYAWGALLHAMLEAYGPTDAGLESRARFLGICFSFMDWTWWVEIDNQVASLVARDNLDRAIS